MTMTPADRIAADFARMHREAEIRQMQAAARRLGLTLIATCIACAAFLAVFHDVAARTAATVIQSEEME